MGRTFTLSVPEAYPDVDQWLEDLPYGKRSQAVCDALQKHIEQANREERMLRQILDEIRQLRAEIPLDGDTGGMHITPSDPGPDLDGETITNLGGLLK